MSAAGFPTTTFVLRETGTFGSMAHAGSGHGQSCTERSSFVGETIQSGELLLPDPLPHVKTAAARVHWSR